MLRIATGLCLLGAWHLGPRGALADKPLLEVMYLKYNQESIDTTPVFTPTTQFYEVRLDWKMKFFSVQARPVPPAVIDNIHLCPQDADCSKQDQLVVAMDFSRNIIVPPGARVRFRFDVLLQGVTRTYTLTATRLEGSETAIRHMVLQSATLYPSFHSEKHEYRSLLPVNMELASLELHLQDSGQTILASANAPVLLEDSDNITSLRNSHPGNTRAPPTRLRLRRLRERDYGEFQYPNKYVDFPVPLASKRLVTFKVISADGGHFGYYSLELGRPSCGTGSPLFDATAGGCVSFCDLGFWADREAGRCKRCAERCLSCQSLHSCLRCPGPDGARKYILDNTTGSCIVKERHLWERHPEHAAALAFTACSISIFLCGLCAFCMQREERRSARKQPAGVSAAAGAVPDYGPSPPAGRALGLRGGPASAGYAPISGYDNDAF